MESQRKKDQMRAIQMVIRWVEYSKMLWFVRFWKIKEFVGLSLTDLTDIQLRKGNDWPFLIVKTLTHARIGVDG